MAVSSLSDDSSIPPLDDMSEILAATRNFKTQKSNITVPNTQRATKQLTQSTTKPIKLDTTTLKDSTNTQSSLFSGLAGGFLNHQTQSSHSAVQRNEPKIVDLDATPDKQAQQPSDTNNTAKLFNIQSELKQHLQQSAVTQAELTQRLLNKLTTKPNLMKQLARPEIQRAFSELQTNPTSAIAKYASNKDINEFIVEFMQLMGDELQAIQPQSIKQDIKLK